MERTAIISLRMALLKLDTTQGLKNKCKVQRVSADNMETAVLKYLHTSLDDTGYIRSLGKRIQELAKISSVDFSNEISRLQSELEGLNKEASNIYKLQAQGSYSDEALKMMSERLENIAKRKKTYTEELNKIQSKDESTIDHAQSAKYIHGKLVEFERTFNKVPSNLKKRLIRNLIKKIALSKDELLFWFYLDEDDLGTPGRKLKLVRDEQSQMGLALVSGDNFSVSNHSVPSLDICVHGEGSANLLEQFKIFSIPTRHIIKWSRY